ncbi:MAG TPA: glycosyltransferase [Anaerolineae bacterium]
MTNQAPRYDSTLLRHPAGSRLEVNGGTSILYVPGSAGVALDKAMAQLWRAADGSTLAGLVETLAPVDSVVEVNVLALRVAGLLLPPLTMAPTSPGDAVPDPPPLVSVVIVSRNGRHHLEECLPSLAAQTYPRLEIILVDDVSTDDTEAYVRQHFPSVHVVQQANGPNFAAGCNQGIAQAQGDLIFLLNNDTVLDPYCVEELVAAQTGQDDVAGVAAMMRFYHNRPFVNGLGTNIRRFGFGYDLGIGNLDVGQFELVDEVPFLCFGAALIPRRFFDWVGPIEEAYQFYYEDTDWSYRARALGFKLIAAPRALVYHKFGSSTGALPSAFKKRLATRNRLWFVLKNYPVAAVPFQFWLYLMDDWAHLLAHLARKEWRLAAAIGQAWLAYWRGASKILAARQDTWRGRLRAAVPLSRLAEPFPWPQMHGSLPRLSAELVEKQYQPFLNQPTNRPTNQKPALSEDEVTNRPTDQRVLIISPDTVSSNMGGVGIRYWELARQLAQVADVTLAVPNKTGLAADSFVVCRYDEGRSDTLESLVAAADVVLLSGFTIYHHPFLRNVSQYLVVDLYDPMVLENLERFASRPVAERNSLHRLGVTAFNELFSLGDFFICASEKQRDYWLGALTAANRVNPATYTTDPTLRCLIDTVPFGLPDEPPQHTKAVLKGVRPGIGDDDKVILWGGGLWDWLDPLTTIEAMPSVLAQVPEARLFFLGTRHPNPAIPPSRMAQRAIEQAEALGLKNQAIFFNEWTPYEERVNYLCEADVGVSLHGDHVETRFAVRTRLMDYLWARLPMVVSRGDTLSDLVKEHELGRVVAAGDVAAVAQSLIDMLQSPAEPARFGSVVERFRWSCVAEPLKRYVQNPWRNSGDDRRLGPDVSLKPPVTPVRQLPQKAVDALRHRGVRGLIHEVHTYIRWIRQL